MAAAAIENQNKKSSGRHSSAAALPELSIPDESS
jgi:hypothetical protein